MPGGYSAKVLLLWIGFIGIFAGIAAAEGPYAVVLPISLKCKILTSNTQDARECCRRILESRETAKEMDLETRAEIMRLPEEAKHTG